MPVCYQHLLRALSNCPSHHLQHIGFILVTVTSWIQDGYQFCEHHVHHQQHKWEATDKYLSLPEALRLPFPFLWPEVFVFYVDPRALTGEGEWDFTAILDQSEFVHWVEIFLEIERSLLVI